MANWRGRGRSKPTAASVFDRLQPTAQELAVAERWAFEDMPLVVPKEERATALELSMMPAGLMRVTGLILPYGYGEGDEKVQLQVDHWNGGLLTLMLDTGRPEGAEQLRKLAGLLVEMDVDAAPYEGKWYGAGHMREGSLREVVGVQRPMRPGEANGTVYGVVTGVERSDFSAREADSYGIGVSVGGPQRDKQMYASWNPSSSQTPEERGITQVGSVVAVGMVATNEVCGMWNPGDVCYQVAPPVDPTAHS